MPHEIKLEVGSIHVPLNELQMQYTICSLMSLQIQSMKES